VLAHSAIPVYYRIHRDTSVDLEDIRSRLDGSTRVLMVTHYFGFPQDMPSLRAFCDAHGLILIEDCAHAFFGQSGGQSIGWHGDYAVASARKFFPTYDGGYLTSSRHSIKDIALKSGGFVFHAKAALDIVEEAGSYGRLKSLNSILALPNLIKGYVWGRIKSIHRNAAPISIGTDISGGYRYLDLAQVNRRMSTPSRLIVRMAARSRIVRQRRANYNKLAKGLSGLANARPLIPQLPDTVVPYMFPLLIDDPERDFPRLKQQGVPIFRWEDMEAAECATSLSYSLRLLQLPCHQELRPAELDWMIKSITDTLGKKHR
jgi:dTDP-4-amino-4,6-dideoxygalactose transaminase